MSTGINNLTCWKKHTYTKQRISPSKPNRVMVSYEDDNYNSDEESLEMEEFKAYKRKVIEQKQIGIERHRADSEDERSRKAFRRLVRGMVSDETISSISDCSLSRYYY